MRENTIDKSVIDLSNRAPMPPIFPILLFIYSFWAFSGFGTIGNILAAIFGFLLVGYDIVCTKGKLVVGAMGHQIVWFLLYFLYNFLTSIYGIIDFRYWITNTIIYEFLTYLPLLIENTIRNRFDYASKRKLLKVLTLSMGFVVFTSIIYYILNPGMARDAIVYQSEYDNLLIGGGYFLAYGSCILAVFVFSQLLNYGIKDRKQRKLALFCCIVCAIHVVLTNSTLTLIWLMVGFALCVVFRTGKKYSKKRKVFFAFIIVAGILLFFVLRRPIGELLMNLGDYSSESLYKRRLYELGTVISSNVTTRHTQERLSKITMSWAVFKTSPIIGVGYKYGYTFSSLKSIGLGTHSAIFDTLAKYGIVGTFFWGAMLISHIRNVQKMLGKSASNVWWIILIAMMLWNPFMSLPSMLPLLLIIPLIAIIIKDEDEMLHYEVQ